MDSLLQDFEKLKVSAFSKYSTLQGEIGNVTIGPDSISILNISHETTKSTPGKAKRRTPNKDKSVSKATSPLIHMVQKLEEERKEKLQQCIDKHYDKFEGFTKRQSEEKKQQWILRQQGFIQNVQDTEEKILQTISQQNGNASRQQEKLVKHYQDMLQKQQIYEQQLARKKEAQKVLNEIIERIKRQQLEFRVTYQEILTIVKNNDSSEELKVILGDKFKLLKSLQENFEQIILCCKTYNVRNEHLIQSDAILNEIKKIKQEIQDIVLKLSAQKKDKVPAQDVQVSPKGVTNLNPTDVSAPVTSLSQCVTAANLKKYVEMQQFLTQYSNSFNELLNDEQLKQFKFDCKKAVNIPVNAISSVSADHLRDKYIKLNNLLAGKIVVVADKQINASRHPQGIPFCMDLLAKKFVLQGDLMISSNPEAAFCYATIIISLWNDFPHFGKLLLGYLYTQCPYLVPFYIPKTEEQTTEEYYTRLGYRYVDGQIEKQDKFLKRMTGILRLYFAIFIAKPRRDQQKNPHDLSHAWNYLASLLKLEPVLDITATCLHILLETVGFEMERVYGVAFKKLVKIVQEKFIPALKKIDSGGPVTRLEVLLQNYEKEKCFNKPKGILSTNFW